MSASDYYSWLKRLVNKMQKYDDLNAIYWEHYARSVNHPLVYDMQKIKDIV